ncbi:hypothetical protein E2C01_063439 [Portunus trituberculatus]|uniref:Uncharacterized protein n=1 Tax=Portunus trituberculatus TaxID=210409 RepID=A0A5B7HDP3_PORTR|nr:hypothetical protein [Portunus trituberculatus]
MDHRHPSRPPITHADPGPSAEINPQRWATLPASGLRAHSMRIFTPIEVHCLSLLPSSFRKYHESFNFVFRN